MNVILLSGGSGKRLWPLSNDVRSKQFIKIFKRSDGSYESMIQRTYRKIKELNPESIVTIATSKRQVSVIRSQLGENIDISIEPYQRDTFPAIALAAAYLYDEKGVSGNEAIVVCPIDPYVDDIYFASLRKLWDLAQKNMENLFLMGIEPTYPSEKYGYIIPETKDILSKVISFQEKPDKVTAAHYIEEGGLWNAGVFACKLSYVLGRAHKLIDFTDYDDLKEKYEQLEKISFDYAVVEREPSIKTLRFSGQWKDLGTWNTLTEAMQEQTIGNVYVDDICKNVHVINELGIPILATGLKDIVIAASPEGVLVSEKAQSSYIKPFVDLINQQIMFAEKSWGSFRVLNVEKDSLTIKVTLSPSHRMNYHSHNKRDEAWTVVRGSGWVVVDGDKRKVQIGSYIYLPVGCKHTVIALTELQIIEVQLGLDINVNDKKIYNLEF